MFIYSVLTTWLFAFIFRFNLSLVVLLEVFPLWQYLHETNYTIYKVALNPLYNHMNIFIYEKKIESSRSMQLFVASIYATVMLEDANAKVGKRFVSDEVSRRQIMQSSKPQGRTVRPTKRLTTLWLCRYRRWPIEKISFWGKSWCWIECKICRRKIASMQNVRHNLFSAHNFSKYFHLVIYSTVYRHPCTQARTIYHTAACGVRTTQSSII